MVTVLGTQFNVNARSGQAEVALASGKVKVELAGSQTSAEYLEPGEKLKIRHYRKFLFETKNRSVIIRCLDERAMEFPSEHARRNNRVDRRILWDGYNIQG